MSGEQKIDFAQRILKAINIANKVFLSIGSSGQNVNVLFGQPNHTDVLWPNLSQLTVLENAIKFDDQNDRFGQIIEHRLQKKRIKYSMQFGISGTCLTN